jgi:hypothetical protein
MTGQSDMDDFDPQWTMTGPGSFKLPKDFGNPHREPGLDLPKDEETPAISYDREERFGFAEGDRVAIVEGEFKGAWGKVEHVGGCWSGCKEACMIIYVELQQIPPDVAQALRMYRHYAGSFVDDMMGRTVPDNVFRFYVREVTHAD